MVYAYLCIHCTVRVEHVTVRRIHAFMGYSTEYMVYRQYVDSVYTAYTQRIQVRRQVLYIVVYGISVLGPQIHDICIHTYTLYSTYTLYIQYVYTVHSIQQVVEYMLSWVLSMRALYMDLPRQVSTYCTVRVHSRCIDSRIPGYRVPAYIQHFMYSTQHLYTQQQHQ